MTAELMYLKAAIQSLTHKALNKLVQERDGEKDKELKQCPLSYKKIAIRYTARDNECTGIVANFQNYLGHTFSRKERKTVALTFHGTSSELLRYSYANAGFQQVSTLSRLIGTLSRNNLPRILAERARHMRYFTITSFGLSLEQRRGTAGRLRALRKMLLVNSKSCLLCPNEMLGGYIGLKCPQIAAMISIDID